MTLNSGELLNGRYRIERILGQGGMGAVYLATDESLAIPCAVKENISVSPETERLFKREATLLATLRHHHLPRVTNHFILGDQQYLVMDYVEGEDLKERLAREERLPEADVLRWAGQICDALTYLHARTPPVIHRDIKPGNIKLNAAGEAILVDFGIAKATPSGQKTTTSAVALTPGFAPPEQYGMARTDARTDQYALAATIFNLLCGRSPPESMERLLGNTPLPPPETLRPGLSAHVAAALKRALQVKPDDRFKDIAEFKAALTGEIVTYPPTVRAEPAPTVVAQSAARTQVASSAQVTPTAAATRPARPGWLVPAGIGAVVLAGAALFGLFGLAGLGASGATDTPAPTATQEVKATEPPAAAPATDTPAPPTETPASTDTPTPAPPTHTPTVEPSPTATNPPIGGGGRIAFISNRDGQTYQVYTMNPDGSDVKQLTFDPAPKWDARWQFNGTQLAWSPDGTKLLYVAPGDAANGLDIWMISADGSSPVDLTAVQPGRPAGDDYHPAWCADGRIWFTSRRVNNSQQLFYTTLEDVQAERRPVNFSATHGSPTEYDATVFPDCKRIIFVTTSFDGQELRSIVLDGSSNRTFRSGREFSATLEDPAVSPDGQYVAYTRRTSGSNEVILTPVDDRLSNIQLTITLGNSAPQFSPDGQWIVFISTRDQHRQVYVMTLAATDQRNLSNTPANVHDTDPVWQPRPAP